MQYPLVYRIHLQPICSTIYTYVKPYDKCYYKTYPPAKRMDYQAALAAVIDAYLQVNEQNTTGGRISYEYTVAANSLKLAYNVICVQHMCMHACTLASSLCTYMYDQQPSSLSSILNSFQTIMTNTPGWQVKWE